MMQKRKLPRAVADPPLLPVAFLFLRLKEALKLPSSSSSASCPGGIFTLALAQTDEGPLPSETIVRSSRVKVEMTIRGAAVQPAM